MLFFLGGGLGVRLGVWGFRVPLLDMRLAGVMLAPSVLGRVRPKTLCLNSKP